MDDGTTAPLSDDDFFNTWFALFENDFKSKSIYASDERFAKYATTRGVDIRNLSDYKDDDWIRLPPFVAQLLPELVWHLGLPAANYFKDKNGITLPAFQGVTVEGFFYSLPEYLRVPCSHTPPGWREFITHWAWDATTERYRVLKCFWCMVHSYEDCALKGRPLAFQEDLDAAQKKIYDKHKAQLCDEGPKDIAKEKAHLDRQIEELAEMYVGRKRSRDQEVTGEPLKKPRTDGGVERQTVSWPPTPSPSQSRPCTDSPEDTSDLSHTMMVSSGHTSAPATLVQTSPLEPTPLDRQRADIHNLYVAGSAAIDAAIASCKTTPGDTDFMRGVSGLMAECALGSDIAADMARVLAQSLHKRRQKAKHWEDAKLSFEGLHRQLLMSVGGAVGSSSIPEERPAATLSQEQAITGMLRRDLDNSKEIVEADSEDLVGKVAGHDSDQVKKLGELLGKAHDTVEEVQARTDGIRAEAEKDVCDMFNRFKAGEGRHTACVHEVDHTRTLGALPTITSPPPADGTHASGNMSPTPSDDAVDEFNWGDALSSGQVPNGDQEGSSMGIGQLGGTSPPPTQHRSEPDDYVGLHPDDAQRTPPDD